MKSYGVYDVIGYTPDGAVYCCIRCPTNTDDPYFPYFVSDTTTNPTYAFVCDECVGEIYDEQETT